MRDGKVWVAVVMSALVAGAARGVVVLDQIPADPGIVHVQIADSGCSDGATPVVRSLADDFVLPAKLAVASITWLGFYDVPAAPRDPEPVVIRILANDAGDVPGGLVRQVVATVTQTALLPPGNATLVSFTATFAPVTLLPGTYWIELFETDDSTDACFGWVLAASDPLRGRPGAALSDGTTPGVAWTAQPAATAPGFALRVDAQPPEEEARVIPTLDGGGLAVLALALGAAAAWLRHRRT